MGDAGGAYRARPRIHATDRGSGCSPAGYRSKFPLECSSTSVALRPHASCATYLRYCTSAAWISFRWQTGGSNQSLVWFDGLSNLWCPGAEVNHRHLHFQCSALPTELPGRRARRADEEERGVYRGSIPGCPEQPVTLAIHVPDVSSPGFAADFPSS